MRALSPHTIAALVEVITGGPEDCGHPGWSAAHRTGTQMLLEEFGLDECLAAYGNMPLAVRAVLQDLNGDPDSCVRLVGIVESAVDSREYLHGERDLDCVVDHLNKCLRFDKLELRRQGDRHRLVTTDAAMPVTNALKETAVALDLDTVQRDAERALDQADEDPEDAITAACSMVESVCRSLLRKMEQPLPANKDIAHLVRAAQRALNLSPERDDIAPDIKQVLGGLFNAANGIGALRTHAGDAHGKDAGTPRSDSRTARLAIRAASTVSLFFIETWQRQEEPSGEGA